jgi:hypothetical protein
MASAQRSYSAGKFMMRLDGVDVGFVLSLEGGEAFGEVIDEAPVGGRVGKHLGKVGYAPIVVEVGASMEPAFFDWVTSMLDGTHKAKDGAIVLLDYDSKERARLEWKSALITEVVFPGADGSSKLAGRMRVTIQPEATANAAGSGAKFQSKSAGKMKAILESGFSFAVSGLELACKKVAKVTPLVVRQTDVFDVLDVADIVFWLPESEAEPFAMWFADFVLNGNNNSARERSATLTFLDPTLKNELMRIEYSGVGIFRMSHERQEASAEVVARVKVEMYCESVRLHPIAAVVDPVPPPPVVPAPAAVPAMAVVESLAAVLLAALQGGVAPTVTAEDAITERLLGSVAAQPPADERERGRVAGRAWAADHARLDELEATAKLADRDDWSALALADGHSLVVSLAAAGDLAADETGPVDLRRDDFTSGLVAGAAEIYRSVAVRLGERRPPPS